MTQLTVTSDTLSILVIHYKAAILSQCLEALRASAPGVQVWVVDTGGLPSTADLLAFDYPEVIHLHAPNVGLAFAVNVGLKALKECGPTPFVAHMNDDVLLEKTSLASLLKTFEDPHVGMVGPRVCTPSGAWQDQGVLYRRHYLRLRHTPSDSTAVPWLSGCIQLLRWQAITHVGGMNSSLRFYNEDMEWCWRLRQAGWQCKLNKVTVTHLGGTSTPAQARFSVEGYRGGMLLSQRYKSRLYRQLHWLLLLNWARLALLSLSKQPTRHQSLRAVTHMLYTRSYSESPFGETLDTPNPLFGYPL